MAKKPPGKKCLNGLLESHKKALFILIEQGFFLFPV